MKTLKNQIEIKRWDVDAQPVDDGFASYIAVEFKYANVEYSGSIQEDCGNHVEFINDNKESDFYELDDEVTEYILSEAFDDIRAAQKEHLDDIFMEALDDREEYPLIESVADLIMELSTDEIPSVRAYRIAVSLIDCNEDSFSICDAMISLQIELHLSQEESSKICRLARCYDDEE